MVRKSSSTRPAGVQLGVEVRAALAQQGPDAPLVAQLRKRRLEVDRSPWRITRTGVRGLGRVGVRGR